MADGLAILEQADWSAGAFRSVARELIPGNGAYSLQNLLLNEDGAAYKRGGSKYLSNAVFGATGLRWLLDVFLAAGERTLFAGTDDFGVLAADGVSPVNLGGAGLAGPVPCAVIGGLVFVGGGTVYGGSRKAADYSVGTVALTKDSAAVTGAGTAWAANVDAGMLLGNAGRYYVVESVQDDTHLTLTEPFEGTTASGATYTLVRLGSTTTATGYRTAAAYAVAGDKLVTFEGRRVWFSAGRSVTGAFQPHVFESTEYHELPEGAEAFGGQAIDDVLYVFSTGGIWAITNVYFPLTDDAGNLQRQTVPVSRDVVCWGVPGVATWQGSLVVPAIDGVWLISPGGSADKLSRSIDPLYVDYVESSGFMPGQAAVYRSHYFLPILNASGGVVDMLVCRLDRPTRAGGGKVWPWTWMRGHGSEAPALSVRVGGQAGPREPVLLAAGADGRVLDLSSFFSPDASVKTDADGSVPEWLIETRDYPTGDGNLNTARRLQIRYELEDAADDDPTITAYTSRGHSTLDQPLWGAVTWGAFQWGDAGLAEFELVSGVAPESDGRDPFTWAMLARLRFVRARLQSSAPAARMTLRSLRWFVRQSGKER